MTELMEQDVRDLREAQSGSQGAQQAFGRLYDRHAPVVRALCRKHAFGDPDDALQETFIRAFRKLDTLDDPARLRPWLYGIARNVCSEERRAKGRRKRHEAGAAMKLANANHASTKPVTPAANAEHAEQLARLSAALDQLPERERLAIHLYYLETDPVAAASESLNISRSAFYKLLARARELLAAAMTRTAAS